MAAPMISGVVADFLQTHPTWTPDQIKAAVTTSGLYTNSGLQEIDANKLSKLTVPPPPANQGLTPNNLITDAAGDINYSLSSWNLSSWSTATGAQRAGFSLSSWSCTCTGAGTGAASPSLSSWSLSSWSTLDPLVDNPGAVRGTSTPAAKAIADAIAYAAKHPRH
jgi:hypothetical protein